MMTKTLPRLKLQPHPCFNRPAGSEEIRTQEQYFQQIIESNPLWKLVGIYSDYSISVRAKRNR